MGCSVSAVSVKWRNRLYVFFLFLSACATFIGPIGISLHWSNDTMGLITSLVGMLSAASSIIARNDIDMTNVDDHIIDNNYIPKHSETDNDVKA